MHEKSGLFRWLGTITEYDLLQIQRKARVDFSMFYLILN